MRWIALPFCLLPLAAEAGEVSPPLSLNVARTAVAGREGTIFQAANGRYMLVHLHVTAGKKPNEFVAHIRIKPLEKQ